MKNIAIAVLMAICLITTMFAMEKASLERHRAKYWKAEYDRLWHFAKMVEIPVRNLIPGTIRLEPR